MAGLGLDEEPTLEERVAALEELARAALRFGPTGAAVATATAQAAEGLSAAAAISGEPERVRFMAGVREALRRLFKP